MAQTKAPSKIQRFARANFSPSFQYPLKGIWYFATHRYLHPLLQSRLLPLTLLSTCILGILAITAYLPIVAFLALFHYSGSAWVNGTFFILGIGTLLTSMVFEALFADGTQVDIFDAVMVAEGYEHLVKDRRPVADNIDESDPVKRIGPREKGGTFAPFSFRQIIELIILLPLNFVPFVGVPLFLLLTGYRAGPLLNWRYFQLKGFDTKRRNQYITTRRRRFEYMWFGTVYMVLQLIPVLSMLFLLTSAAGSALWSVHVEQQSAQATEGEGTLPEYTDDA
ncbi:hypothetical protein LTR29_016157 [Friedmanniomyces endolithicus]|nr:hypothetical protein LTR29_016157 [Friedmanniomyces endolithicus]